MRNIVELGRVPIATASPIHSIPEFSTTPPDNSVEVPEGDYRIGGVSRQFFSKNFTGCSAILIKDICNTQFILFHAVPDQKVNDKMIRDFTPFRDGALCLIEGSQSFPKGYLLRDLYDRFDLTRTNPIVVETWGPNQEAGSFNVAYRPLTNQVLVAVVSYDKVLTYNPFKQE